MMMMMLSVSQTHTLRTNRKKIDWLEIKATYKLLKDNTTTWWCCLTMSLKQIHFSL